MSPQRTILLVSAGLAYALVRDTALTMRGVVYNGTPLQVTVQDLPIPSVLEATDAIIRITASAICGTDLHIYRGFFGGTPPWVVGHEAIGFITEIGDEVSGLAIGDYVVVSSSHSDYSFGGVAISPDYYGFGGATDGFKYARIPFAASSLIPIPITHSTTNATVEADFLTVSDIFATGWAALDFAGLQSGDSVAVFGAGPVGLLAAHSAILRGASRIYVIDHVAERLTQAFKIGAIPVNFLHDDPVAHILRKEPGGVDRAVDCVGMEAVGTDLEIDESIVIKQMIAVTRHGGGIGVVGAYVAQPSSPGAPRGDEISPNIEFSITEFFNKGLTVRAGPVDPMLYAPALLGLIGNGRAHPGFVFTTSINIDQAPEYYERFHLQREGKIIIRP